MQMVPIENLRKSPMTLQTKAEWETVPNIDPKDFAFALQQEGRNRYSNIFPPEHTRVKSENDPTFYFNANWVLDGQAIACQGPLPNEIDEFWKMVWEGDIRTIVMLTNLVEKGVEKCSLYWGKLPYEEKSMGVAYGEQRIIKRKITIERNGVAKKVVQYHLMNWPDQGTVVPEMLGEIVTLVARKEEKFLVHCSAGVGRTGTLLTAYQAFKMKTREIKQIVQKLRTERVAMVQSPMQYRLILKTLGLLFTVHRSLPAQPNLDLNVVK